MSKPKKIDMDLINKLIEYNRESSRITWKVRGREFFNSDANMNSWNARWSGKIARSYISNNGYIIVKILKTFHQAHRLVWAMHTGCDFTEDIDHINGDRTDNIFSNLRAVERSENTRNRCKPNSNSSGVMGVYFHKRDRKWHAQTQFKGVLYREAFSNFKDAVLAREAQLERCMFSTRHGCLNER